ncbi:MAG: hypothetical protein J6S75_04730 [Thermoguttaceae bacterium]|nr:hypothetical protein [Thermoguttaceae bacterium]
MACFAALLCVALWSLLLFLILTVGLIEYDRNPTPGKLQITAALFLLASLCALPLRGGADLSVLKTAGLTAAGALFGLLLFGRARWRIGLLLGALTGSVLTLSAALAAAAAALLALGLSAAAGRRLSGLALFIGLLAALILSPLV